MWHRRTSFPWILNSSILFFLLLSDLSALAVPCSGLRASKCIQVHSFSIQVWFPCTQVHPSASKCISSAVAWHACTAEVTVHSSVVARVPVQSRIFKCSSLVSSASIIYT